MKTWKLVLIGIAVVFLIAAGVIAYFVNSALSGGAKDKLLATATKTLGTKVDLQSYSLDFKSLLRMKPSVRLSGLAVANPKGFSTRNLLEAQEVDANLDLRAVMDKRIEVTSLNIISPKVLLETTADGKTNLEALLAGMQTQPQAQASAAPAASSSTDVSVAEISLTNGLVSIASAEKPQPEVALRNLNLKLTDLADGKACHIELDTQAFETGSAQVKLAGMAGPFGGRALPIDAKAEVALPLAEIPAKARQEHFGELAADPGKEARIDMDLSLKGDLYQATTGSGQLKIEKYLVGPAKQQGRLSLSGTAPIALKAIDLMSFGELELSSQKAAFSLGSGRWDGNLRMQRKASRLTGQLNGSIQNVDVNQMLTSFASTPNKVYGTLAIPAFDLKFEGMTPDELKRSLAGQGRLSVSNGKIQGLSVLAAIERALGGAQTGQEGGFAQLSTNFGIQKQVISLNNINVAGPGIQVNGQGTVTFNEALNFRLQSKLAGATAEQIRGLSAGFVSGDLVVPVQIAGTLSNPQVRPEVKGLMKSAATSAVQGILGNFLNKKKK